MIVSTAFSRANERGKKTLDFIDKIVYNIKVVFLLLTLKV